MIIRRHHDEHGRWCEENGNNSTKHMRRKSLAKCVWLSGIVSLFALVPAQSVRLRVCCLHYCSTSQPDAERRTMKNGAKEKKQTQNRTPPKGKKRESNKIKLRRSISSGIYFISQGKGVSRFGGMVYQEGGAFHYKNNKKWARKQQMVSLC